MGPFEHKNICVVTGLLLHITTEMFPQDFDDESHLTLGPGCPVSKSWGKKSKNLLNGQSPAHHSAFNLCWKIPNHFEVHLFNIYHSLAGATALPLSDNRQ